MRRHSRNSAADDINDSALLSLLELMVEGQYESNYGEPIGDWKRRGTGAADPLMRRAGDGTRHDAATRRDFCLCKGGKQPFAIDGRVGHHLDPTRLEIARAPLRIGNDAQGQAPEGLSIDGSELAAASERSPADGQVARYPKRPEDPSYGN